MNRMFMISVKRRCKMKMAMRFWILLVLMILASGASFADVVILNDGQIVEGIIVEKTDRDITMDCRGVKSVFMLSSIKSIEDSKIFSLEAPILHVNQENRFVVVEIGKRVGVKIGDLLEVWRGEKKIALLSVISVRDAICAAEIREGELRDIVAGDKARFKK